VWSGAGTIVVALRGGLIWATLSLLCMGNPQGVPLPYTSLLASTRAEEGVAIARCSRV